LKTRNDLDYNGAENIKDEANAGWYLIHVNNGKNRVIEFTKPEVYVFGPAVGGRQSLLSKTARLKCVAEAMTKDLAPRSILARRLASTSGS